MGFGFSLQCFTFTNYGPGNVGGFINFAKENGLFVTMGTNGSLVKRKIDDIKRIDALVTSYDGPKAHNIYRENGSSKKMIEAISTAVENGIKVWNVTVLSRNSMDDIDYILGLSREIGFHTYFTPMMNLDSTGDTSLIIPPKGDYKRAIEKLMKLKKEKSNRILNSVPYLNYIYNWPDFKKTLIAGNYNCYASKLFCHIAPNGKVFPCINLMHKVDGYDALGLGFKNAFSKLSRIECRCSTFSFVELNLLFSLNFVAICNSIKQL